jgi:C4-dicarboxylate transporter DctM subunit
LLTVGHFRGGLAMASVLACMLFAALSGSSPATVVAIGTIAIAGMRQVGYSKEFASGVIANAGTLGILIPPSIVMVVYAAATDVSVGRMFLAGVCRARCRCHADARDLRHGAVQEPAGGGMEGFRRDS